jgi:serine/threonine protein kinase
MLDALTTAWSRPYKIVRVLQALGMEVPQRLRRERLALMLGALERNGIESVLADNSPIDPDDSPGIEAKIRLRRIGPTATGGRVLGFEVVDRHPSGGMSECYTVRDPGGAVRFLKVVPIGGVQAEALRRELEIYAKLTRADAEHVLRVFESPRDKDQLGLLMEHADGGTLAQHVELRYPLDTAEVKSIALSILAGLQELHALNIVHRDLKPQNVLRCAGAWKLADFGISKNLTRLVTQGRTFQQHGSSGYTAPEQWAGADAHPTADIYAFGKLLVYLCTQNTDIDRLGDRADVAKVVRKCVEFQPNARASIDEIRELVSAL